MRAHPTDIAPCDVQPDQVRRPARAHRDDASGTHAVQHDTPFHLCLDGDGTVDAECGWIITAPSHVAAKLVRARRHHDLVNRTVADGCDELRHGAYRSDLTQLPAAVQHKSCSCSCSCPII